MKVLKLLSKSVRQYKKTSVLTLLLMVGEAVIESLIPYITATRLINTIQEKGDKLEVGDILQIGRAHV